MKRTIQKQSEELHAAHQQRIYRQTDRMFAVLMGIQWIGGIVAALVISPRTWIGQTSDVHAHVWAAVFLGGIISFFPILLAILRPGHFITRYSIAVGQMLMSSLLIHLTGGRIETHFHVFGSLAFLSFYRDWRVLVPATLVVAVDHMLRGIFYPQSVFGVLTPDNWRWIEHAGWVIFEDIFLVLSCLRGQTEMRQVAYHTAKLDASEARYRSVTDSASDAIITIDEQGTILFVNRSAEHMFGYTTDELTGKTLLTLLPEKNRMRQAALIRRYAARSQNMQGQVIEVQACHKDGHEKLTEVSCADYDFDGSRIFTAVVRDITERRRAEEALKKSEEYVNLFRLANDAIIIFEPATEIVLNVNDYACKMYGYERDEFVGKSLKDISENASIGADNVTRLMAEGALESFESVQYKKDGSPINILINSSVIEFEGKRAVLSINRDITERKNVKDALEENLSLLTSTFGATADGIVAVGPNNNIITANAKWVEMWQIPDELANLADNTAGVSEHMIGLLRDPNDLIALMERSRENPEEISMVTLELGDGRVFERYTQPQKLAGQTVGRVMSFRDITDRVRAEETVRDSESRYRLLFDHNPYPIWVYDAETLAFLAVNHEATSQYGYTAEEFLGMTIKDIRPPEDVPALMTFLADAKDKDEVVHTVRHQRKDGSVLDVEVAAQTIIYDGRRARIGLVTDLTERKQADAALRLSENRLRTLLDSMSEGLLQVDEHDRITYINDSICEMTGFSQEELIGTDWSRLLVDDGSEFVSGINERRRKGVSDRYETRIRTKSGELIWVIIGGAPIHDAEGAVIGSMGVFTDITERKRAEQQLLHDALHDGLTGLANRTLFMDHLRLAIERGKSRHSNPFAVLYLDFDRFKVINDSLGHSEGDKLLKYLARRLETCTRTGDLVARLGGDEFVILLSELVDADEALMVAERIQNSLKTSFDLGGREIFITTSIGITLSSSGYKTADNMVRDADIAMYFAKSKGKAQYQMFDHAMHKHASKKLQIETEMRTALERNEFALYYQPIIRLGSMDLVGFEALIRWEHPERGTITPDEFIPIAEENGMIIKLGHWTVKESCRQLRKWQKTEPLARDLTMSVNLSCKEFLQLDLAETVAATLASTGIEPRLLKLEITESHIMENSEMAVTIINRLRTLGVEMSLDDFGTGYSSLSYLHRLPVNFLKIDRSFVGRMVKSDENREIVNTIIRLAQNLKMKVIAEGIETIDQLSELTDLNCEYGQGYFFSKPLDAAAAKKYIAKRVHNPQFPQEPPINDHLELMM